MSDDKVEDDELWASGFNHSKPGRRIRKKYHDVRNTHYRYFGNIFVYVIKNIYCLCYCLFMRYDYCGILRKSPDRLIADDRKNLRHALGVGRFPVCTFPNVLTICKEQANSPTI